MVGITMHLIQLLVIAPVGSCTIAVFMHHIRLSWIPVLHFRVHSGLDLLATMTIDYVTGIGNVHANSCCYG